jgi:hypothetical protein
MVTQEEIGFEMITYARDWGGTSRGEARVISCFGHIQQRPVETPVCSEVIRRSGNEKRDR